MRNIVQGEKQVGETHHTSVTTKVHAECAFTRPVRMHIFRGTEYIFQLHCFASRYWVEPVTIFFQTRLHTYSQMPN